MRSACASRDLVPRRILEPAAAARGRAPATAATADADNMMVYPDPQWTCTATAPMLQLYDDVGYRGKSSRSGATRGSANFHGDFNDGTGDDVGVGQISLK